MVNKPYIDPLGSKPVCSNGILNYFCSKHCTFDHYPGQIIATSAEVTPQCSLVGESSQNSLNSGLGIILLGPEYPDRTP